MGERLTAADAAHRIGRSEKTVRHWIAAGWLTAEKVTSTHGPAAWAIDGEELLRVAAERAGKVRAISHDAGDLAARVAHLEARIAALEAARESARRPYVPTTRTEPNLSDLAGEALSTHPGAARGRGAALAYAQPRPRGPSVVAARAAGPLDEAGGVPLSAFAAAHGVNRTTAIDHAIAARFPTYRRDNPARPSEHPHYLTPDGQRLAARWWQANYAAFQRCASCPHDGGEIPAEAIIPPAWAE